MGTLKDLLAYQKAFSLAMEIFELSKHFPNEEKYSLTDQIRRSSRSVNANLAEAYRKRRYPNHFVSKLSDADCENGETQTWLEFAFACQYISKERYDLLYAQSEEIARLLVYMMNNPGKFLIKATLNHDGNSKP
ncbi:MAG TPA: four helix bundle protein [Sphingobacteriaceae bacterium]